MILLTPDEIAKVEEEWRKQGAHPYPAYAKLHHKAQLRKDLIRIDRIIHVGQFPEDLYKWMEEAWKELGLDL